MCLRIPDRIAHTPAATASLTHERRRRFDIITPKAQQVTAARQAVQSKAAPVIARVQHKVPEKALRIPSDLSVIIAGAALVASAGVVVIIVAAVLVLIGCVVFAS